MKEFVIWFVWSALWTMILFNESRLIKRSYENLWPMAATYTAMMLVMALYIGLPRSCSLGLAICYGTAGGIIFESILSHYSKKGAFDLLARLLDRDWQIPVTILAFILLGSWTFSVFQINERVLEFSKFEFLAKAKPAIHLFSIVVWSYIDLIIMSIIFSWAEGIAKKYRRGVTIAIDGYG